MNQVDGTECTNPDCRHRDKQIPTGSRCQHCGSFLHNAVLGCSIASVDGDGKMECLPHIGCKRWTDAGWAAKRLVECSKGTDDDGSVDASEDCQIEKSSRKRPLDFLDRENDEDLNIKSTKKVAKINASTPGSEYSDGSVVAPNQPTEKNGAKRGPKYGQTKKEHTKSFWYSLCLKYESIDPKMDVKSFLDSSLSGLEIVDNKSNRQSFKRYLNRFQSGTLIPEESKRKKIAVYPEMEEKLVTYLKKRQERSPYERIGISRLRDLLMQWKTEMPDQKKYSSFKASHAFIEKCLARNNLSTITLTAKVPKEERRNMFIARFESELSGLIGKFKPDLHHILNEMEKELRIELRNDDYFDEEEHHKSADGPGPMLVHEQAMEMVQSLMSYASQNSFSEESVQGLQKYAKELNKQRMNQGDSQQPLNRFSL